MRSLCSWLTMVRGSCSSWVVLTVWLLVTLPSVVQGKSKWKGSASWRSVYDVLPIAIHAPLIRYSYPVLAAL